VVVAYQEQEQEQGSGERLPEEEQKNYFKSKGFLSKIYSLTTITTLEFDFWFVDFNNHTF